MEYHESDLHTCWYDGRDYTKFGCKQRRKLARKRHKEGKPLPMPQCLQCFVTKKPLPLAIDKSSHASAKGDPKVLHKCRICGDKISGRGKSGLCIHCVDRRKTTKREVDKMTRIPLIEALAQLRYPTKKVYAALDWNLSVRATELRLIKGKKLGWLHKSGKYFIPTAKALDAWVDAGLV